MSNKISEQVDTNKSIEELEEFYWLEPAEKYKSNVVIKSNALRKKPLSKLTNEDVRTGLIQQIGIIYIVPIAIDILKQDPMVESLNFEGEILGALLDVPRSFWLKRPYLAKEVDEVYEQFTKMTLNMRDSWKENCLPAIIEAYDRFCGNRSSKKWLRPAEQVELH